MKICILVNDYKKPWAEAGKNNVREISRRLRQNHTLFFMGCSDKTEVRRHNGADVYLFKSPFYSTRFNRLFFIFGYLNLMLGAKKILKRESPDIFLSYFETGSTCFFTWLVKAFSGSRAELIHVLWTDWYTLPTGSIAYWFSEHLPHWILNSRPATRFGLRFADRIIASSRYLMRRSLSLGFANTRFIPSGVNTDAFYPDKKPIRAFKEKIVIGYVGHLTYTKGVSFLLDAVIPLLEPNDMRLVLAVTDGEEEEMIRRLHHPNITVFRIVDTASVYTACDLMIVPRRFSYGTASYPNVVMEAMSCGTPVLCSRLPGISEIIKDGKTGFLFTPNDPDDLKSKVEYLIQNKTKLKQAGGNARKKIQKDLDWDKIVPKLAAMISET